MTDHAPALDLSKYIEARFFGERPHICGRRVPVAVIACNARSHGWSLAETAGNITRSEAEVAAALLYYEEHRDEIDAQEAAEQKLMDEMHGLYGKD